MALEQRIKFLEEQLENATSLIASQVDALEELKESRGEIIRLHEAHTREVQQLQEIAQTLRAETAR